MYINSIVFGHGPCGWIFSCNLGFVIAFMVDLDQCNVQEMFVFKI